MTQIQSPYLPTVRRTGDEQFALGDQTLPVDLLGFWQWSASDLLGNTMRGCLAEYIVAMALETTSGVRNDWEAYDLKFNDWKIEVKASGYLQTWPQKRLSRPIFSIRPARSWDPATGRMTDDVCRQSDVYVFCLHHHKDKATVNSLDLAQWSFYVLPTVYLDRAPRFNGAKSISLSALKTLKPSEVAFSKLGQSIKDIMSQARIA